MKLLSHRKRLSWLLVAISALFITGAVFGASMNAFAKVGPSVGDVDSERMPETSRPWFTWFDIDLKAATPLNIPANATEAQRQGILRERLDEKATKIKLKWRGSRNAVGYEVQRTERIMDLSEPLSTDPESMQWGDWVEVKSSNSQKNGKVRHTYNFDETGKSLGWHYAYVTYGYQWHGTDAHAIVTSSLFVN